MKVIKYGEGYEPKIVTCEHCKSELEYTREDLRTGNYYYKQRDDGKIVVSSDCINDGVQVVTYNLECPVCSYNIATDVYEFKPPYKCTLK